MQEKQDIFKKIPGVDKLLNAWDIKELISKFNPELVKFAIRETLNGIRQNISKFKSPPSEDYIIHKVTEFIQNLTSKNLKPVFNSTGVIVHTNLGRAPFSDQVLIEAMETLKGYNNLEFDLDKGERGSRHSHLTPKLKYLTGAEDVLVVNNNAAAVIGTPIAVAVAQRLGVNPEPFVLAVLFGANMSYATPFGYQTNLLILSAGGYKFSDFLRVGIPLTIIMWVGFSFLLPVLYNF